MHTLSNLRKRASHGAVEVDAVAWLDHGDALSGKWSGDKGRA